MPIGRYRDVWSMKQFALPLRKDTQRPVVYLKEYFNLYAMLDTGSIFPVWVGEEKQLLDIGAIFIKANIPFGGFGGIATGNVYRLSQFRLGELVFPSLPIIASKSDLPCQMLISATMFRRLVYEVDDCNHKFHVTIPNHESCERIFKIEDKNGKLHILCMNGKEM